MLVYSLSSWLRVFNFMLFIGALRAGGDTRYAMFTELFSIWVIGVPSALIGGFVFHLPVYGVYAHGASGGSGQSHRHLQAFISHGSGFMILST